MPIWQCAMPWDCLYVCKLFFICISILGAFCMCLWVAFDEFLFTFFACSHIRCSSWVLYFDGLSTGVLGRGGKQLITFTQINVLSRFFWYYVFFG